MILAGDIGGTKVHLALFQYSNGLQLIKEEKYHSHEYDGLSSILKLFLQSHEKIPKACFGIAGPIQDNRCKATNLPWIIDGALLSQEMNIKKVWLINDLEANAWGLRCLSPKELYTLNEGNSKAKGNAALISAGTGLGEAGLYWDGEKHHPFACEGGHADFAPHSDMEIELLKYLRKKNEHVSYERLVSGPGLSNIYQFLIEEGLEKEEKEFADAKKNNNLPKIITEFALAKKNQACVRALDCFVSIYGSEAGNLALKFMAIGGVFIGGGIAPKILKALESGIFMKAFVSKGRFAPLLSGIPIKVVLNENTALLGAAQYAHEKN